MLSPSHLTYTAKARQLLSSSCRELNSPKPWPITALQNRSDSTASFSSDCQDSTAFLNTASCERSQNMTCHFVRSTASRRRRSLIFHACNGGSSLSWRRRRRRSLHCKRTGMVRTHWIDAKDFFSSSHVSRLWRQNKRVREETKRTTSDKETFERMQSSESYSYIREILQEYYSMYWQRWRRSTQEEKKNQKSKFGFKFKFCCSVPHLPYVQYRRRLQAYFSSLFAVNPFTVKLPKKETKETIWKGLALRTV